MIQILAKATLYRIGAGKPVDHINDTYPSFYVSSKLTPPDQQQVEHSIDGGQTWHAIATWERNQFNGWSLKLKYEG